MLLRSKRVALLIGALLCALAVAFVLTRRSGEPRADGHSLTYWVNRYAEERPDEQASVALSQIGTNAIPYLLAWLEYERPSGNRSRVKQMQWVEKTFGINVRPLFRDRQLERANNAAVAFCALGADASLAVPRLREVLQLTNPSPALRAARALSEIPGSGVQELLLNIKNPDPRIRARCANNLRFARTKDSRIVSALLEGLRDDEILVSFHASRSLRQMKVDPGLVVPVHAENLHHSDPGRRAAAAFELAQFGTNARSAAPALILALADGSSNVQAQAKKALESIAPEVLTNRVSR